MTDLISFLFSVFFCVLILFLILVCVSIVLEITRDFLKFITRNVIFIFKKVKSIFKKNK